MTFIHEEYDKFIQNIIIERGQWSEKVRQSEKGCERHHIIPLCILGIKRKNVKKKGWTHDENIIWLYPSEHYEAHKILAEENPTNYELVYAFFYMSHLKDVKDSETYEKAKELFRVLQSEHLQGRKLPEDHKQHIRNNSPRGKDNPACRPEVRKKISQNKLALGDAHPMRQPGIARKVADKNSKRVKCLETGIIYKNAREAREAMGFTKLINIGEVCRGNRELAGGYHWAYVDEN